MIRCLIIDDEPKAIELLQLYVERLDGIAVDGSFRDPIGALKYIEENRVDFLFLDINMPKISGISLAKIVNGKIPIVFTTAYSEYAVESYDIGAIDYLLKPISFDRFYRSIERVKSHFEAQLKQEDWIIIKSGNASHRVKISDIIYLEKDGNYCFYHTQSEKIMARESTAEALGKLSDDFIRVHKSYIVNITKVAKFSNDSIKLIEKTIPIGDSFKKETLNRLNRDGESS